MFAAALRKGLFAVSAALMGVAAAHAAPVTSPGDLAGGTLIDFESYAIGTGGPLVQSGVTISGTGTAPTITQTLGLYTQFSGIVTGKIFGFFSGTTFNIVFDDPVSRVGLGVFDPNYPAGNVTLVSTLRAYDAGGNVLETTTSGSAAFPVGPTGGVFSTYVGFKYATDVIKRIELVGAGSGDVLGIDNVSFIDVAEVPEPSTYALLLAGLAGMLAVARRRSL